MREEGARSRIQKKIMIGLTVDSLIWLIGELFKDQYVAFGSQVLHIAIGALEGISSSTKFQNSFHQKLVNNEVDRLRVEGREDQARLFMTTIWCFVDDSLSLEGMLSSRDITNGTFKLETVSHERKVTFLGTLYFKCKKCKNRMGTAPDCEKNDGRLFPEGMLDNHLTDNTPQAAQYGLMASALYRVYRLSSCLFPLVKAVEELLNAAAKKGYNMSKVNETILRTIKKLLKEEPKPQEGTPEQQEAFERLVLDRLMNRVNPGKGQLRKGKRTKRHRLLDDNLEKKRKRSTTGNPQENGQLCEFCTIQL